MLLLVLAMIASPVLASVNITAAREHLESTWWSMEFQSQALEPDEMYYFHQVDEHSLSYINGISL